MDNNGCVATPLFATLSVTEPIDFSRVVSEAEDGSLSASSPTTIQQDGSRLHPLALGLTPTTAPGGGHDFAKMPKLPVEVSWLSIQREKIPKYLLDAIGCTIILYLYLYPDVPRFQSGWSQA